MNPSTIDSIEKYKKFLKELQPKVSEYEDLFNKNKDIWDKKKLEEEISFINDDIKLIKDSKTIDFLGEEKTLSRRDEDKPKVASITTEINSIQQELEKQKALYYSQIKKLEELKDKYTIEGLSVTSTPEISNTEEAIKLKNEIISLVKDTPSISFYTKDAINNWEKEKRDILARASKLQGLDMLYGVAQYALNGSKRTTSTLTNAKDIANEYFSKASEIKSSIKKLEEYYSKYLNIVKPATEATKQDDIKSDFDALHGQYDEAKKVLNDATDEQKQKPEVKDAISKIEQFYKQIESLNMDDSTAVTTMIKLYRSFYQDSVKKALSSIAKTIPEKLTNKQFEEKSLSGQIEYASKTGNALGKTVADVVKDAKHNLSDWQKQEILSANSKGVTPIEMASIADKIDRLSKTPATIRNSFIPKFSKIARLRANKQDTATDYRNLLSDMRIAILSLPTQDLVTNNAIALIDDALTKNTIEDMQKAYDVALSIQNNPDYVNNADILRQQYAYYYADNKEAPTSVQLLDLDNGRKIMQNMVNIAKAKTEQLRDIPPTAGNVKIKNDIENKTNNAVANIIGVINSIKQKQKQIDIQIQDEEKLKELRKTAPEVKPVATVQDNVTWQSPDEKMVLNQMKQDLTSIIENISEQLKSDNTFIETLAKAQKALSEKDVNEFYRNYRILEQMKNSDAIKIGFVTEYQNMIQQLNSLKAGKQDMIVIDINNAINKISELFKIGTEESINSARDIYNEMIAVIKSKEVGANTQITPPSNEQINKEPSTIQGEVQNV